MLRRFIPKSLHKWVSKQRSRMLLRSLFNHDLRRFKTYSAMNGGATQSLEHVKSRMIASYHVLEKGLSFDEPRPCFGVSVVQFLMQQVTAYKREGGDTSDPQFAASLQCLSEYFHYHRSLPPQEIASIAGLLESIELILSEHTQVSAEAERKGARGGHKLIAREDYISQAKEGVIAAMQSRVSCRSFTGDPVDQETLARAIGWSLKSPSVCNRQGTRIYSVTNRKQIDEALNVQSGARGFSHTITALLVVASDLRIFMHPVERNQAFTDGGLFTMNLMYALQHLGLGTCPLNWAKSIKDDNSLRDILKIEDHHEVIVLLGVGHMPEQFKVPHSQRRPLSEILITRE